MNSNGRNSEFEAPITLGWSFGIITVYIISTVFLIAQYSVWYYNKDNLVCSKGINVTERVCEYTYEGYSSVRILRKTLVN